MAIVICVHSSKYVDHCNIGMHLVTIFELTHAKILVSALEGQASWGHTYVEVVSHQCKLASASKEGKWRYYTCDINYHQ